MKVSSISPGSIESLLINSKDVKPFSHKLRKVFAPLLKALDRIGTAIALGETGDLEAAHEFRSRNSGE